MRPPLLDGGARSRGNGNDAEQRQWPRTPTGRLAFTTGTKTTFIDM